jgi:hypothetical protein
VPAAGALARSARAAAATFAVAAGCGGDAITVEVDGDLPVGSGVDAICLAVADSDPGGGHFGQTYAIDELPQTLRVEPGSATDARAWVIGYRAGVPVARDAAALDFGGSVTLRLDRCGDNPGGAPQERGAAGPANAVIAPLVGRGGTKLIAIGGGEGVLVDAAGGSLVDAPVLAAPPGNVLGVVAFDADGDCDDDVIAIADGGPPELWRVEGDTFTADGAFGSAAVRAAAAADIDRDGDVDVLTAIGSTLTMYKNDGSGRFTTAPAAITGIGFVGSATSLAFGDLDGDRSVDVVVGQAAAPLRAFAGAPGGGGAFTGAPGILPDVAVDARSLRLADADGDGTPELWVAVAGEPARIYVDRAGTLENQSYVRLPQPTPEVNAFAVAGWDQDCAIDAVAAATGTGQLWRGDGNGALVDDGDAPGSTAAELLDLDDDGDLDLVVATAQGVVWLAR